jgi:hypothetical protein
MQNIKRLLRGIGVALLALILFIEEWGWRPLSAAMAWLARRGPLKWLETRIVRAPRHIALMLFVVPAILLFPVKLLALWAIGQGHKFVGILVIVLAKLLGTALVGRIYVLTQEQLLSYPWFARAIAWWVALKARVKAAVYASPVWQAARDWAQRARSLFASR